VGRQGQESVSTRWCRGTDVALACSALRTSRGPDFPREHAIRLAPFALPALALALTACSSDPPKRVAAPPLTNVPTTQPPVTLAPGVSPAPTATSPSATRRPTATPRPTASTDRPVDPLSPRPPLETAPPVGLPACAAGTLSVADADAVYDPDAVRELFTVRTSGPDCQLPAGYPAAQVLDSAGAPIGSVAQGGPGLPAPGAAPLTLSRSTSLSFFLRTGRDGPCTGATTVVVTLSGTSSALRAPTGLQVCGGALATGPLQRLGDGE